MRSEELPVQHFLCPWVRKRCSYGIFFVLVYGKLPVTDFLCVCIYGKTVGYRFFVSSEEWFRIICRNRKGRIKNICAFYLAVRRKNQGYQSF